MKHLCHAPLHQQWILWQLNVFQCDTVNLVCSHTFHQRYTLFAWLHVDGASYQHQPRFGHPYQEGQKSSIVALLSAHVCLNITRNSTLLSSVYNRKAEQNVVRWSRRSCGDVSQQFPAEFDVLRTYIDHHFAGVPCPWLRSVSNATVWFTGHGLWWVRREEGGCVPTTCASRP